MSAAAGPVGILAELPAETGSSVRLSVEVRARGRLLAGGVTDVPIITTRPNGPDCEPECRVARGVLPCSRE